MERTQKTKKSAKTLEPQQARSRESLRKLLKAAAEVLGQHGVEGTTIPRIAEHAGLTAGSVYRRFRDKDELLETTILGILERQEERLKTGISPEMARQIPLTVFAEQVIGGMVLSYRANASLFRAMRMFAQGRRQTAFWKKAARYETRAITRVVELFLSHREEIRHPNPEMAITFGLTMIVSTLFEIIVMATQENPAKHLMPKDDNALKQELLRSFLHYLGVGDSRQAKQTG